MRCLAYDVSMNKVRRGTSTQQKRLKLLFCGKPPTLYYPGLISVFGFQLGLLLSQLAYWQGKGKDPGGWIFKTAKELQKETGLTAANQKHAIKLGKKLGVLEVIYRQTPRKRHYKILWEKVAEIVTYEAPKYGLKVSVSAMKLADNNPTNTKITQNTTSKTVQPKNQIGEIIKNRWLPRGKHNG